MAKTMYVKAARKFVGTCEKCFRRIDRGFPYKWIGIKAPRDRSGTRRIRCADCEDWHEWDYNPSMAAQCKRVAHDTEYHLRYSRSYDNGHGAELVMRDAAAEIHIFANTRQVSADRTARVFGDKNFRTRRFQADAKALQAWAKRMQAWRCPELPEPEWTDCSLCSAKGMETEFGGDEGCVECGGEGRYIPDGPNDDQLEQWRQEVADDAVGDVLGECPI